MSNDWEAVISLEHVHLAATGPLPLGQPREGQMALVVASTPRHYLPSAFHCAKIQLMGTT